MIRITIILSSLFFTLMLSAQEKGSLTLTDFDIEKVPVPERKSAYYQLTLKESREDISIRLFSRKPEKIIASFFDDRYLIFVYKTAGNPHYLVGAYFDGERWVEDYFDTWRLDISTGVFFETLKTAKFLDGETLLLTFEVHTSGKNKPTLRYSILRICQDQIYQYDRRDNIYPNKQDHNPIRPKH